MKLNWYIIISCLLQWWRSDFLEVTVINSVLFRDVVQRKKKTRRHRQEQSLYMQLSDAMDCLEHICSEGCTSVGPYDMDPEKHKGPCSKFSTCQGIQLLIRHFGACKKRVNGGCSRCTRMWQLFRLHSSICDQPDECRVPLCRYMKHFFMFKSLFSGILYDQLALGCQPYNVYKSYHTLFGLGIC